MRPLVSILVPAFNAQQWISDTLRSATAQTWPRKEIIVVDDGSTDKTLDIARQFASQGVIVVSQSNQGASAARNTAYSLSHGDYIQWLDADDLLSPGKIAAQMGIAERCSSRRALFTCAWGSFMYRHYRARFVSTALWCDLTPVDFLLRKMGQYLWMQTATWLVSRELTDLTGSWDNSLVVDDDGDYFCRAVAHSDGIRFVPDARVYYRTSGLNRVSYIGGSEAKIQAQWRSIQMNIRVFRSLEDSERVRAACGAFLQAWLKYFPPEGTDIVEQVLQLGRVLGEELHVPELNWKYAWIQKAFGWSTARRAQLTLPALKWSVARLLDKAALSLDNRLIRPRAAGITSFH